MAAILCCGCNYKEIFCIFIEILRKYVGHAMSNLHLSKHNTKYMNHDKLFCHIHFTMNKIDKVHDFDRWCKNIVVFVIFL